MQLTTKRKEILEALKKAHKCLSARALVALVPSIDQATVYRNLDLFAKEGVVKKYVFDGSESVYEYALADHHHAVCSDCEKVLHIEVSDKKILDQVKIQDFDIDSVELVVRGRCKK